MSSRKLRPVSICKTASFENGTRVLCTTPFVAELEPSEGRSIGQPTLVIVASLLAPKSDGKSPTRDSREREDQNQPASSDLVPVLASFLTSHKGEGFSLLGRGKKPVWEERGRPSRGKRWVRIEHKIPRVLVRCPTEDGVIKRSGW